MATIKIKSKDDNFFIYELGVIKRDEPRNYHAKQTVCGDIRAEMVGDEQSDLFNPIHFSKIEVDGQTFSNANDCVTALNKVIYNDVASGGGTDAKLDALNTTSTAIKDKLEAGCDSPINVKVCNQVDLETLNTKMDSILEVLNKIAEPLTANEYDTDEDCGCMKKDENGGNYPFKFENTNIIVYEDTDYNEIISKINARDKCDVNLIVPKKYRELFSTHIISQEGTYEKETGIWRIFICT